MYKKNSSQDESEYALSYRVSKLCSTLNDLLEHSNYAACYQVVQEIEFSLTRLIALQKRRNRVGVSSVLGRAKKDLFNYSKKFNPFNRF